MLLKVQCENCKTKYKLDETRIEGRGARITCPKCRHVFVVMKDSSERTLAGDGGDDIQEAPTVFGPPRDEGPTVSTGSTGVLPPTSVQGTNMGLPPVSAASRVMPDVSAPAAAPAPSPATASRPSVPRPANAEQLSWKDVGITTFKVKVAIGLVYDFSDVGTLKKYIAEKRVVPTDRVSFDGKVWHVIKDIPNLEEFFIDQWVALKSERLQEEQRRAEPPRGPAGPVFGEPRRERRPATSPGTGQVVPFPGRTDAEDEADGAGGRGTDGSRESAASRALLDQDLFGDMSGSDEEAVAPVNVPASRKEPVGPPLNMPARTESNVTATRVTPVSTRDPIPERVLPPGRSSQRFEQGVVVVLLVVAGYLGYRFWSEGQQLRAATEGAAQVDTAALTGELDGLFKQHLPLASAAIPMAPSARPEAPAVTPAPKATPTPVPTAEAPGRPAEKPTPAVEKERKPDPPKGKKPAGNAVVVGNITADDLLMLGQESLRNKDYDGAIQSFKSAAGMKPKDGNIQYSLGLATFQAGRLGEAEGAFKKCLSLSPKKLEAHKWLGELYARQGKKSQAVDAYRRYLEGSPRDADAIRSKIEKLSNS